MRCGSHSPKDAANRGGVLGNDAVVAGEASRLLGDHAETRGMVVASGDQRRTCRGAQRGRVEVGIAQTVGGDAVQGGCRDNATERGWGSEANIVGHDKENVRCAFRRHHACRPI